MTVPDNTIQVEGRGVFFKNLGRKVLHVSKKMAKNVKSNPGRALGLTAKIATPAVSKNSEQAVTTTPELTTFYSNGRGLCLRISFILLPSEWSKKQTDYTHLHL